MARHRIPEARIVRVLYFSVCFVTCLTYSGEPNCHGVNHADFVVSGNAMSHNPSSPLPPFRGMYRSGSSAIHWSRYCRWRSAHRALPTDDMTCHEWCLRHQFLMDKSLLYRATDACVSRQCVTGHRLLVCLYRAVIARVSPAAFLYIW